jgi:TonB-dependent starch-binding outer membrane protein SusC
MRVTARIPMEQTLLATRSLRSAHRLRFRTAAMSVLSAFIVGGTALGQSQTIQVTGTVTSPAHVPISGVGVRVQGTDTRSLTDASGKYAILAPANGVLAFTRIGQRAIQELVNGRAKIDVTMEAVAFLEEVVVTAYTTERRSDITGAVASVNVEAISRPTSASVLQRLGAAVPGVTVEASGSPGSRTTVRIRGVSSFQNNDPLYIIDGVPLQDSYINFLNPDDITSIQVLKDASAASIYGSRASNGVVIVETTKRGVTGSPRATLSLKTGVAKAVRGYDDFLITNPMDYFQVLKQSYLNAGLPVPTNIYGDPNNPTLPKYIYAAPAATTVTDQWGRPTTVDPSKYSYPNTLIMPGSTGTDWWKAMFGTGGTRDLNLDISGGGPENQYGVSFNYFNQKGTAIYNTFNRGSVRANTSFNRGRLSFGENALLSLEEHNGGIPDDPGGYAEDGILGKNILMQTVIPIYDINGNFAGGKASNLGNQSNPVKEAFSNKDNVTRNNRVFGSVFGELAVTPQFTARSRLGFNVGLGSFSGYNPPFPENAEATFTNSINENSNQFTEWTWSNTLKYDRSFNQHGVSVLVGQEANGSNSRFISGGISSLLNTDVNSRYIQDALGDAATKTVSSSGGRSSLLSVFGKADYNYASKYVASVTLRRDGSSRLAPGHQWGTFPAFGLGWRLSKEPFLEGNKIFSDVMLRYGYGITGNQLIPSGRIVALFGGSQGDTFYDIGGQNSIAAGFRQATLGNPDLKWEEDKSANVGADMTLFNGALNVVVDVYRRTTNNLLFDPAIPATAGIAAPPIVNVGKMNNSGFDFSIGHNAAAWSLTLNAGHYNNKIVSINGDQNFFYGPITTRYGNQVINQVGSPIGAFYGYIADGFFKDAADVTSHAQQDGAAPGRIKFRDINGDGKITLDDRTTIGSPHPKFTSGLDLGLRRGNWDLNATVFGSYGNKIFENQMEFYVFQEFSTNVRSDLLANSWTPTNQNAKYPRLDVNDLYSHALSSYYVKDGTYTRLQNVQLGYNVPPSLNRWLSATRVYVGAENLFTITGYDGLDPALPPANVTGSAGDIRDQYRGIDRGSYPSSRMFTFGIITSF